MTPHIISPDRIRLMAGEKRFELGRQYLSQHPPSNAVIQGDVASATVDGYAVSLTYRGDAVEGSCSCPESEGFEFCHHCVCLLLFANKQGQQVLSLSKGPDKSKVLAYLLSLDKSVLAKQMLEVLERDPGNFKRYLLKASLDADALDYTALKKELTALTRPQSQLFSQRQVKHFFSRIERFLEEVSHVHDEGRPEPMLKLVEYGIARINQLLEKVDDRSEQRETTAKYLNTMFQRLFEQLSGRDETLCKRFEKNWLNDPFQLLGLSPHCYFSAHQSAFELLQKRLKVSWKAMQWPHADIPLAVWQRNKIARYFIEHQADQLSFEELQLMGECLAVSDHDYLRLAERWHQSGDAGEALRVLGKQLERDNVDTDLAIAAAKISLHLPDAETRLMALLKRYPLLLGRFVLESSASHGFSHTFYLDVIQCLSEADSEELWPALLPHLVKLKRFESALLVVQRFNVDTDILEACIPELSAIFSLECIAALEVHISRLLEMGMVSADKKAARLMRLFESIAPEQSQVQRFILRMQPKFRTRPKFVESYDQLKANSIN